MTATLTMLSPWSPDDLPPRLAKRVTIDPASGCWRVTTGWHDRDGYTYYAGEGAHRAAYKHLIGAIPVSRPVLDHVRDFGCIWRDCIWPAHLEAVTVRINTMRGCSFAARNAAKDRCDHGHLFDEANTYDANGRRSCRRCNAAAVARYQQRLRQASAGTLQLAA